MIPLAKPDVTQKEIAEVVKVLESGQLSMGQKVLDFENAFSEFIGKKYAIAVNSGTSGLHLCIKSMGITEGAEVITTPFSFVASANCILFEKAKPVFVDICEDYSIDPTLIENAITERTKAILVVHPFGNTAKMEEIMSIANKHKLFVVEDACESIGAKCNEKYAGSFGDLSVFAFYPNKQITTGEGGMILTDNEDCAKLCRSLRNQGRSDDMNWLTHERLGYNYRLDEMSAAVGLEQVKRLKEILNKREEAANMYNELLSGTRGVEIPSKLDHSTSSWFVYPVRVDENIRDRIIAILKEKGISSKAYFFPAIHLQPFYIKEFGYKEGDFPVCEKLSKQTIVLPFFTRITKEEICEVVKAFKEALDILK